MKADAARAFGALVRIILGGVFVASAFAKIADLDAFAESIRAFGLLPETLPPLAARFIPAIELVAGFAAMTRGHRRGALLVIGGLLLVFSGAILSAIARDLDVSCGCFGSLLKGDPRSALGRNLLLLAAAVAGWFTIPEGLPPEEKESSGDAAEND